MDGPINERVTSALAKVFSGRSAILKIVEEKALGTRLSMRYYFTSKLSQLGEGNVMPKFRIESRNSYQRSETLLGKTHCDRMTEENSKKDGYLCILLFNKGYQ